MSDRPKSTPTACPKRGATTRGRALLLLRTYRGPTQAELAKRSGVNKSSISAYERDRHAPNSENLEKLLGALGLSLSALDAACRLVERLDAGDDSIDPDNLARSTGHYAENLIRFVLRSLRPALEARP